MLNSHEFSPYSVYSPDMKWLVLFSPLRIIKLSMEAAGGTKRQTYSVDSPVTLYFNQRIQNQKTSIFDTFGEYRSRLASLHFQFQRFGASWLPMLAYSKEYESASETICVSHRFLEMISGHDVNTLLPEHMLSLPRECDKGVEYPLFKLGYKLSGTTTIAAICSKPGC